MGASLWPDGRTTSDWYEVAGLLMEMQRENLGSTCIEMTVTVSKGQPDLLIRATAVPEPDAPWVAAGSVSASVLCSRSNYTSLKGVLISLIYQLDFLAATHLEGSRE